MKAILFREIKTFFGSPIGYLVIAIFLLMNGLFLWVFEGDYNIMNSGFADLNPFFVITPWIFIFLIPAITMRSFADEKKLGTMELLLTKPLSVWQIVLGKFFGAVVLILIAIFPTIIYVWCIYDLGLPTGNLDFGSTLGSYFGLIFLISSYVSIGIFASSITDNQIVSFIISVFFCFLFYFGFEGLASTIKSISYEISYLGIENHYKSMSRGVLDTRDIVYFLSLTFVFLLLTVLKIDGIKKQGA